MEYYSAIKESEIIPLAAQWMGLEIITRSEVSQTKKDKDITYMWNLKKWYKGTYVQCKKWLIDIENKLMTTKGEKYERNKLGVWNLTDTHYYI